MLFWNEIRHRAIGFSRENRDKTSEESDKQSFWNDFFHIFGIKRSAVASFEEPVKKLSGNLGKIDLFWPGKLLVEHKSAGQDLDKAHAQGMAYIRGLIDSGRQNEVPRWLIVSDFKRIALHDLEPEQDPDLPLFKRQPPSIVFPLEDLHKHIRRFAFIPGYKQHKLDPEDPANIEAAELMAKLHDALLAGGFSGHDLRVLLVRLLFCLFADDTGIFNQKDFHLFIENRTATDGSDTGTKLARLFDVLNTPEDQRQSNLDEDLAAFPYINGDLFAERIAFADFNAQMRGQLLKACAFKWERISPAVFGSLFQGVMDPTERRQIGAHYTAEKNILKLIRPLFLDELRAEFDAAKADKSTRRTARLEALHERIAKLRFLDPACGCGNFLVITYRELRALELEILLELHRNELSETQHEFSFDVTKLSKVDVDQMHGIEIEEFPAKIAEVALWLADHQANIALSETFGQLFRRIPLRKSPPIVCANALRTDWKTVLPPEQCSYILGNPPFIGSKLLTPDQKADTQAVFGNQYSGVIDFVGCWYRLCVNYCATNPAIRCALVSTNSITQGEQVAALWPTLFSGGLVIHFAHRTFQWESEARGKAHVHCVIIGFGLGDVTVKAIYDYPTLKSDPQTSIVSRINCYLVDGPNVVIPPRTKPLFAPCPMANGSIPADGGNLILSRDEKDELLRDYPQAAPFVREYLGAEGVINGESRWCLWLANCPPEVMRSIPPIVERVQAVRDFRKESTKAATRAKASIASLFTENRQPTRGEYLAFPRTSSETRRYIPIAYLSYEIIAANDIQMVPDATIYQFGILTSAIHMAWMATVTGRLESRFRYSNKVVYNNYPWPMDATDTQRHKVEECASEVLAAREQFPGSTLADLYDPVSMPPRLAKAHEALDRAVDRCYRKEPFATDRQRVEYLFALYEQLNAPLALEKKERKGRTKNPPSQPNQNQASHD
jgi:hypothetical protein